MRSKKSGFKYAITARAEWKPSSVGLRDRKNKDHTRALLPMLLVDIVTEERRGGGKYRKQEGWIQLLLSLAKASHWMGSTRTELPSGFESVLSCLN